MGFAHILKPTDRGVTRQCGRDEAGLPLVVLPHLRVETAFGRIGEDVDFIVLIALPHDAAFALLDLRREPRHVEMVQGSQSELRIDAGAHRI